MPRDEEARTFIEHDCGLTDAEVPTKIRSLPDTPALRGLPLRAVRPTTPIDHPPGEVVKIEREKRKFISLFGGIGGFDLAFTRNEWECAGYYEIDKYRMRNRLSAIDWDSILNLVRRVTDVKTAAARAARLQNEL